jgi:hypothetical protein
MSVKLHSNLLYLAILVIVFIGIFSLNYDFNIKSSNTIDYRLVTTNKIVSAPNDEIMTVINNNILDKKNNVLLTAVANSGMSNYTLNWIESLKRCNITKFVLFAIDESLFQTLSNAGYQNNVVMIPKDWFHTPISNKLISWNNLGKYLPITHSKSLVIEHLLYLDITVWFSDVDIVFTSPNIYDYLIHKLNVRKSTHALFQQRGIKDNNDINSGFFIMKPTNLTKYIISESILIQDDSENARKNKITQQRAINQVIESLNIDFYTSPLVMLEMELFPVGNVYFDQNIPMKYGFSPLMVHGNFRNGDDKEIALKEAGLWYI